MRFRTLTCTIAMTLFAALGLAGIARAQIFTSLDSFDLTDGSNPRAGLVQATNGNLYGTTFEGGANNGGTIFAISPSGTLTVLYSFCSQSGCVDGSNPDAALVQATDGNFYGTTSAGGANDNCAPNTGCGTIFKITPSGTLTTLYSFCSQSGCVDGDGPIGTLVQAAGGSLYGTTELGGGSSSCEGGCGTIFYITPSGTLTTLHSFDFTDGGLASALVQAADGNFYGTTDEGGANGQGTLFRLTPSGAFTTLYSFNRKSGYSASAMVQATDGNFYGATRWGGSAGHGSIFRITPSGTLTVLYSFCSQGCTDGKQPVGGLVQATDGNLYGTTSIGGSGGSEYDAGTIFKITLTGTLTTLYNFCLPHRCTDGQQPLAALVQDTNGVLYGTTERGGANGDGSVFSLSVGLGPFVETNPASGKVGASVKILGTDLTGATSVTFNGTAATFVVGSANGINATVPVGATTGTVQVVTPSGTLTSNVPFRATR